MRLSAYLFLFLLLSISAKAQNNPLKKDSFPNYGIEKKGSSFFRERYQHNDLVHYLDNMNDFVTYESETTGNFNMPDQLIFSISGNSFRWNKYYLDGFRLDSRFASGSNNYQPDMLTHSLSLDYYQSILNYTTDTVIQNSLTLRYNTGGIGGISPSTESLVNLFHKTASQRLFKPIEYRNKIQGAGEVTLNYAIPVNGKKYNQQLYFNVGTRMLVDFNENGIYDYFPENFYKIQLSGELPLKAGKLFDKTNYLINIQQRQNLYNEFFYSRAESAGLNNYNLSVYGSKKNKDSHYTTGITLSTNTVKHTDLNFSRNVIDQDGEAFEPWYPDGHTTEITHAINYIKDITHNVQLSFDGFNSLINFQPSTRNFQNQLYAQKPSTSIDSAYHSLYIYDWTSNPFTCGLLENTLSLKTQQKLNKSITLRANLDLTLDGMLMSSNSMIRPNWQVQLGFDFHPSKWFSMELNLSRNRVAFNMDDIRYLSSDYLNADIYFWKDLNGDKKYQEGEKSSYFTSTGGKYHSTIDNLKQQAYFVLDLPFYFRFGKHHEFSVLNSYRKYFNSWTTRFDKPATDYGSFQNVDNKQIYYLNNGAKPNYVVDYYPESYFNTTSPLNFLINSPFYVTNTLKYQYSNDKFLFSFSWTSYAMFGVSTLGNGPLHNNLGVYSESSANPNILYKLDGRNDPDRAYVARLLLSYNVTENLSFAMNGKFKDGQPFSGFAANSITDANGNNQIAIWSNTNKGMNFINTDFGTRKDAFFNIDLRATYKGKISNCNYEIQLMCYNIYDFGTELAEYTFEPYDKIQRLAMELNIPRGLMLTTKIYL